MDYAHRTPDFRVIISRPRYSSATYLEDDIAVFEASPNNKILIGYNYEMSLQSFDSPFSLVFVPDVVNNRGETVLDVLQLNDIVKIEEHGSLNYIGVVESYRYAARMTEAGPDRVITVQGYGIGAILDRFAMLLDLVVLSSADTSLEALKVKTQALLNTLSAEYNPNTSMVSVLEKIRDSFRDVMEKLGEYTSGTGIFSLLNKYLTFGLDTFGDEMDTWTKYPIALSIFSYGSITLGEAWRQIVTKPFYEMFTRWDSVAESWIIVVRPTPYSPSRWTALPIVEIDPLHVTAFDCGYSSQDVKTFFFAYLSGGALGYEQARAFYQQSAIKRDSAKWALYGYRPLEANFRYVNQVKLVDNDKNINLTRSESGEPNARSETISDETLMGRYSSLLQRWFGRADEMLSGTIDVMTMRNNPKIGERISYNGVEFYVESLTSSWQYNGTMKTTLKVTRGGEYNIYFRTGTGKNGEDEETEDNVWFRKSARLGSRPEIGSTDAQLPTFRGVNA